MPVIQVLVTQVVYIGTTLAFMMAEVGLSLPEGTMLKKVMIWRLIAIFFLCSDAIYHADWLGIQCNAVRKTEKFFVYSVELLSVLGCEAMAYWICMKKL